MSRATNLWVGLLTLVLAGGCSSHGGGAQAGNVEPARTEQAAKLTQTGFVPYPNGGWDGSLVDLLAADAYGFCQPWWRTADYETYDEDTYLKHILDRMSTTLGEESLLCIANSGNGIVVPSADWLDPNGDGWTEGMFWATYRASASCNTDQANGTPAAVGPAPTESSLLKQWAAYDLASAVFDGQSTFDYSAADYLSVREAAVEVGTAGMNLCMASRLREQMLSADILIASGEQQQQLLDVIHERSQLALLQYTLLAHAFTESTASGKLVDVTDVQQIVPALREFAEKVGGETNTTKRWYGAMDKLAQDYASALRLYVDSTHELAELVARSASAKADLAHVGGYTSYIGLGRGWDDETWGDASWRGRYLNLIYGGDPFGSPRNWGIQGTAPDKTRSFNFDYGGFAGTGFGSTSVELDHERYSHAVTPVESPEVFTLLGLARQADVLYLGHRGVNDPSPDSWYVEETGQFIYRAVELGLQEEACRADNPQAACDLSADADSLTDPASYGDSELWTRMRITPAHATELARLLVEVQPKSLEVGTVDRAGVFFDGKQAFATATELSSIPFSFPQPDGAPALRWLHLDPELAAGDLPMTAMASAYAENSAFYMPPDKMEWNVMGSLQGFVERVSSDAIPSTDSKPYFGDNNGNARHLGAVPTLAAVRDGLYKAYDKSVNDGDAAGDALFAHVVEMLDLIEAETGSTTYAVRPTLQAGMVSAMSGTPRGCPAGTSSCTTLAATQEVDVHVLMPADTSDVFQVVLLEESSVDAGMLRFAANVAASNSFEAPKLDEAGGSYTKADLVAAANAAATTLTSSGETNTLPLQRLTATVPITWTDTNGAWTYSKGFVLLLRRQSVPDRFTLLADGIAIAHSGDDLNESISGLSGVYYSTDGKYGSIGGQLNADAARLWASDAPNFAEPTYDGFGIPKTWIPPTNPELFGGNDGEDSVAYYLSAARSAADEATTAVRRAVESVIGEEADQQKLAASRDKSEGIAQLEIESVCGKGSGCAQGDHGFGLYVPHTDTACQWTPCLALEKIANDYIPDDGFALLQPVKDALEQDPRGPAPVFTEFQGGDAQTVAVDQWKAVALLESTILEAGVELDALVQEATASKDRAQAVTQQREEEETAADDEARRHLNTLTEKVSYFCSPEVMAAAEKAGHSTSRSTNYTYSSDSCLTSGCPATGYSQSTSDNSGPLMNAQNRCKDLTIELENLPGYQHPEDYDPGAGGLNQNHEAAAWADYGAKQQEVWTAAATKAQAVISAIADIQRTSAQAGQLAGRVERALKRVALTEKIEQAGYASELVISQRYHQYDFWRARALLEDARRLSAAARRAIEGRFAVDMSKMQGDEPFVAAPALWADEVYEFDLDAPAAVGLAATPNAPDGAIYPDKLSDYVGNLENFVSGYAVKRPTASALGDAEIITVAGPQLPADTPQSDSPVGRMGWLFQCTDDGEWATNPANGVPGRSVLNWGFVQDAAPFDNEGFGGAATLNVAAGSVGPPVPGIGGNAVHLDAGSAGLATQPTTVGESSSGVTAIAWVNLESYMSGWNTILRKRYHAATWDSPVDSIGLFADTYLGDGGWWTMVAVNGAPHQVLVSNAPIPLNQWVQVAMTFDGRVQRAYLNGVEVANDEIPTEDPLPIDWGDHAEWIIGRNEDGGGFIDGYVGRVIVDNAVYSPARILGEYQKAKAETQPALLWQFEEDEPPFVAGGTVGEVTLSPDSGSQPTTGESSPVQTPAVDLDGSFGLWSPATAAGEVPSEITIDAWVYPRQAASGESHYVGKFFGGDPSDPPYSVEIAEVDGNLVPRIAIHGQLYGPSGDAIPRDQWSHIAMTYDGTTLRGYVNGTETVSLALPGTPSPIDWGQHSAWFVAPGLDGMIADVRIEPRARTADEIYDLFSRGPSGACFYDDKCVGNLDCCPDRQEDSILRTMCDGLPPKRAKVQFHLDPWGRSDDYYADPPYNARHNVRWGRVAVNLVGVGVRDCGRSDDPTSCYAESFLRYNLSHVGPSWVTDYDGNWHAYGIPTGFIEGGKALAIEEWLDPVINTWDQPYVQSVERHEFRERPIQGSYELEMEVPPDVNLDRIERVQILTETNYWVSEQR